MSAMSDLDIVLTEATGSRAWEHHAVLSASWWQHVVHHLEPQLSEYRAAVQVFPAMVDEYDRHADEYAIGWTSHHRMCSCIESPPHCEHGCCTGGTS